MQKFKMVFFANAEGLNYFDLCIRALNHPKCVEMYEYECEYDIPDARSPVGISHRVTWWRRQ